MLTREVASIPFRDGDSTSEIEEHLNDAGYWVFYRGPLILSQDLRNAFPVYGTNCVQVQHVVVEAAEKNERPYRIRVKIWERDEPTDEKGIHSDLINYFAPGEAVHVMYEQIATINHSELRLWAPKSVKPKRGV